MLWASGPEIKVILSDLNQKSSPARRIQVNTIWKDRIITLRYVRTVSYMHRRSQDICWGWGTRSTPPGLASVVHTFEVISGSWGSVSAPAVSRVMGGAQREIKLAKKI